MLVRIGESEKEPRFVNVRLVIVVIIQSISFAFNIVEIVTYDNYLKGIKNVS